MAKKKTAKKTAKKNTKLAKVKPAKKTSTTKKKGGKKKIVKKTRHKAAVKRARVMLDSWEATPTEQRFNNLVNELYRAAKLAGHELAVASDA